MMLDPIERMEARIDELVDLQFGGVPDGSIRCYGCKRIVPIDQVDTLSANPDAPAYCWGCLDGITETIAHQTERQ